MLAGFLLRVLLPCAITMEWGAWGVQCSGLWGLCRPGGGAQARCPQGCGASLACGTARQPPLDRGGCSLGGERIKEGRVKAEQLPAPSWLLSCLELTGMKSCSWRSGGEQGPATARGHSPARGSAHRPGGGLAAACCALASPPGMLRGSGPVPMHRGCSPWSRSPAGTGWEGRGSDSWGSHGWGSRGWGAPAVVLGSFQGG